MFLWSTCQSYFQIHFLFMTRAWQLTSGLIYLAAGWGERDQLVAFNTSKTNLVTLLPAVMHRVPLMEAPWFEGLLGHPHMQKHPISKDKWSVSFIDPETIRFILQHSIFTSVWSDRKMGHQRWRCKILIVSKHLSGLVGYEFFSIPQPFSDRWNEACVSLHYRYFHGSNSHLILRPAIHVYSDESSAFLCIQLLRSKFHLVSLFTSTSTLWNKLQQGCFPKHYTLTLSAIVSQSTRISSF